MSVEFFLICFSIALLGYLTRPIGWFAAGSAAMAFALHVVRVL